MLGFRGRRMPTSLGPGVLIYWDVVNKKRWRVSTNLGLDDAIETDEYMRNRVSSVMCSMMQCNLARDLSFTIHSCVHLA